MRMKLTKAQADEIRYQLSIVAYEEDELREDYGLTEAQADELVKSVPVRGDWDIPAWGIELVCDRCDHAADILRWGAYVDLKQSRESLDSREAERLLKGSRQQNREARGLEKIAEGVKG
jgi:hypothetical protein